MVHQSPSLLRPPTLPTYAHRSVAALAATIAAAAASGSDLADSPSFIAAQEHGSAGSGQLRNLPVVSTTAARSDCCCC